MKVRKASIVKMLWIFLTMSAIWFSTLFSDIRKKLGDQVVFTNWKGRTVMRAYKKPANPNTLKQQAQRSKNSLCVVNYQTFVANVAEKITFWNTLALARQISGFNLFMKYGLKIDITSESGGQAPFDNTITYHVKTDLSEMGLYRLVDGVTISELVAKGQLESGIGGEYDDSALATGVYQYFIGPSDVYNGLSGDDRFAVFAAHWEVNNTTGVADPAICTVTP